MESISLAKFLSRYYSITNENLGKMTHEDVKYLIPGIKRCSFDYINKNQELISSGNILIVIDKNDKKIPYIKPTLAIDNIHDVDIELSKENENIDVDISMLSNYEVKCWLEKTKKDIKLRRILIRELEKRNIKKDVSAKYKVTEQRNQDIYDDYEEEMYDKHKRR